MTKPRSKSLLAYLMSISMILAMVAEVWLMSPGPAQAADPNMIIFMDSADWPGSISGWTLRSGAVDDPFRDKYIRASNTYNSPGGNPTHTHTLSLATYNPEGTAGNNKDKGGSGTSTAGRLHAHTALANASITPANNLPEYRSLLVLEYTTGGIPSTLPDNSIVMMETASITGNWELYSANDARLVRGSNTTTDAGNNTPTHTVAAGLGAMSGATDNSGSGATALPNITHTHSAGSGVASDGPSIVPQYYELVFVRATAAITTFPDQMIAGFTGATFDAPSDWAVVSASSGTAAETKYYNRFLMGDSSGSLTTGGSPDHSHANVSVTTGGNVGTIGVDTSPSNGATSGADHTHALAVGLEASVDHTPAYNTLVLAQYTEPVVALAITAPANVNLGTGNPGTTVETTFGAGELVTITDSGDGWDTSIILVADLSDGGSNTIPRTAVYIVKDGFVDGGSDQKTIWSGDWTGVTETLETVPLNTYQMVGSRDTSGNPSDSTTVRPTIEIRIPPVTAATNYTGDMLFTVV